jgi:hypothetical protein
VGPPRQCGALLPPGHHDYEWDAGVDRARNDAVVALPFTDGCCDQSCRPGKQCDTEKEKQIEQNDRGASRSVVSIPARLFSSSLT